MIPTGLPSIHLPVQATTIICRAEIKDTEAVCDEVWKLAEASPMAAHWSCAVYRAYLAKKTEDAAMHAKVLFVARVARAGARPSPMHEENLNPTVEQIVGFAAFAAIPSIGGGESTLENMAVAEPWQKQGIGGRLLSAGLLWCRAHAAARVFIEVRESNRAAIALYERAGFLVAGRRPGYYRDPAEDALRMQKILDFVAQGG